MTPLHPSNQLPDEVKRILETHIGTARPGERLLVAHLADALTPYLAARSPTASTLDDPRRQPVESGPATVHANQSCLAPRPDAEWATKPAAPDPQKIMEAYRNAFLEIYAKAVLVVGSCRVRAKHNDEVGYWRDLDAVLNRYPAMESVFARHPPDQSDQRQNGGAK